MNEEFQRIRGYLRAQGAKLEPADIVDKVRAAMADLHAAARAVPVARWTERPAPEEWSGNEVLAHVVGAGRYFGGGILAILDGTAVPARPPRERPSTRPASGRGSSPPTARRSSRARSPPTRASGSRRPWSIPCSGRSTGARRFSSCGSTISTTPGSWGRSPPRWPERGRHPVRTAIRVSRT